jgi:hypothetical protein
MEACGQLHASAALPPGKEPAVAIICVGPRAGMDAVAKRKIPSPSGNRTPGPQSSSAYPLALPTELSYPGSGIAATVS